jgi:hypothetical protein
MQKVRTNTTKTPHLRIEIWGTRKAGTSKGEIQGFFATLRMTAWGVGGGVLLLRLAQRRANFAQGNCFSAQLSRGL